MRDVITQLRYLLTSTEQWQAAALVVALFVGAVLETLGVGAVPAFVTLLTDSNAVLDRAPPALMEALGVQTIEGLVLAGATGLLILFVAKNAYLAIIAWYQARFVFDRQVATSRRLFGSYLRADYSFHLDRNSAQLLRNTNQEVMEALNSCLMPILRLVLEGLTATSILILLLIVEPLTSVAALAILGGTTLVFLRLIRARILAHGEAMQAARGEMIQSVNEGLGGIKVTKVLGREQTFVDAFTRSAEAYSSSARVRQVAMEAPRLVLETVAVAGILVVAGLLFMQGRSAVEMLAPLSLFAVAMVRLIPSFNRIAGALTALRYGGPALRVIAEDLRELEGKAAIQELPDVIFDEAIRADSVTFAYAGTAQPALRDIDVAIPAGTVVGFVGPTGSGKTTLIDILMGLLPPTSGEVLVDETSISGRETAWQRLIGYVPQDIYLADDSIRRNVAFGIAENEIDDEAVWAALEASQASEFVKALPAALDTTVGERGVRLSGGQRQRLGIARALYARPQVLVLDEATSALDTETERTVMDAVEHLRGSHTILLIAHRKSTVKACDRIYHVEAGRTEVRGLESSSNEAAIAEI